MKAQLVAITGGSGSGKTWLVRRLKHRLGRAAGLLSVDDFYRDLSHLTLCERARHNFDHPKAIEWSLFGDRLRRIRAGEAAMLPRYDFATHTRRSEPRRWTPRPIVLLDGLWLLHRPELRSLYALSVFVDCPEELRLRRRLARDQRERGRTRDSVLHQFYRQVTPMHDRFVQPQKRWADLVLIPDGMQNALREIEQQIGRWLAP